MKEHNRKYRDVNKLRDSLESKGWRIKETEFPFKGKICVGTILMEWEIQRSTKIPPLTLEFVAAQIDIYTIADKNDFESLEIKELEKVFYFEKKEKWKKVIKEVCTVLDKF